MSSATRDMELESQKSVEVATASPIIDRGVGVESQNSVEVASMPSIQDLQMDRLEDSRMNPSRFGQIVRSEYTQPDPLMDAEREVITEDSNVGRASGVLLASAKRSGKRSAKRSAKRSRRYHYVKQGKKCKKTMKQYKKLKCRGKRSKKCRAIQKQRKSCKKIIKHKKAMARRSRKAHSKK